MAFNIIEATQKIGDNYRRYLKTIFEMKDEEYNEQFTKTLNMNNFTNGPFLDVVDSFKQSHTVEELIQQNVLHKDFIYLHDIYAKKLYFHQEEAIRKLQDKRNIVVTTGTGSGKTESFLIPIMDSLMKEKEANGGSLTPGVRALIIYPMNALANDQIARLRTTLKDYPDVTFGSYTGQTQTKYSAALNEYHKLNRDEVTGKELDPIPNELISREQMKETPPHILITNYAMLEYLMLRPADNVFFMGEYAYDWRFIVLDEAHTYNGSTGNEVSLLLRRVVAELPNNNIQYILTSATLGDKEQDDEVASFASNLCNAKFCKEDVIRATRTSLNYDEQLDLGMPFYNNIASLIDSGYDNDYILKEIKDNYKITDNNSNLEEYLFDLLLKDKTYCTIKNYLSSPKSVDEILKTMNCTADDLSNFVTVASLASKNRTKLFDSRYHYFIKAPAGVYITLPPKKQTFFAPTTQDPVTDEEILTFATQICKECHSIYINAYVKDGYLVNEGSVNTKLCDYGTYYLGDSISDTDEDYMLEGEGIKTENYEACPKCGKIYKTASVHKVYCEHDKKNFVKLIKIIVADRNKKITKCVCCENINRKGILRSFHTGDSAATAVIGTALYQNLPGMEKKIVFHEKSEFFDDDETYDVAEKHKVRQFLAFSDSRQQAAFYSTYLKESYDNILYSSLVLQTLKNKNLEFRNAKFIISELAGILKSHHILKNVHGTLDGETEAYKAVLKQLVDNRMRNSLTSLGLFDIDFTSDIIFKKVDRYELSETDVKELCRGIVRGMLADVAIAYDKPMSEADTEFFATNNRESFYLKYGNRRYNVKSFIPLRSNGNNKRYDYLTRILGAKNLNISREEKIKFLENLFDHLFVKNGILKNVSTSRTEGYKVDFNHLTFGNNKQYYICDKCHRITTINVANVCPCYECTGKLSAYSKTSKLLNNHYYKLYNELDQEPLEVYEHTAQLNKDEAYYYQTEFKNKNINVLSCSTTFEMGVDIGALETVFMRNMPPSPSNYIQRAGRAGRSSKSAALALTYCKASNHDYSFFEEPIKMIKGIVKPPAFKIDNEKISIRHVYSAAIAFFWRKYPEYFKDAKTMLNKGIVGIKSGYDNFKEYLETYPSDLKQYLLSFLPSSLIIPFKIESFGWIRWLFDEPNDKYPNFKNIFELYCNEIDILNRDKEELFAKGENVDYLTRRINNYQNENIISFLSKNGILPKYGFPVDTVELATNTKNNVGLDLARDLSTALTEYAPGCEIVANGMLIKSRFIRKMPSKHWKMYDYVSCNHCGSLNVKLHSEDSKNQFNFCEQCEHDLTDVNGKLQVNTFIIPDFGFIAEEKVRKPNLTDPIRTKRAQPSIVTYDKDIEMQTYDYGNIKVRVGQLNNGKIAIINKVTFFVCEECGYSEPAKSSELMFQTVTKPHKTPFNKECKCKKVNQFKLGYLFETDILIISIDNYLENLHEESKSILNALIICAAEYLDISADEIDGTIQYINSNIAFVLYDKTPGGAGYVSKLNNQNAIKTLLNKAYHKTKNCTCGGSRGDSSCYNCLRTYRNQEDHEILKRRYVYEYLEKFK